jgi:hypothetical protein
MSIPPEALTFLRALFPEDVMTDGLRINLRGLLHNAPPKTAAQRFVPSVAVLQRDGYAGELQRWNTTEGRSLYVAPGIRQGEVGTKDKVAGLPGFWVDLDAPDFVRAPKPLTPTQRAEGKRLALQRLQSILPLALQPSILVDTGGGLQAWWLFKEPAWLGGDSYTIATLEGYLKGLRAALGGDPMVAQVAALMRVPGYVNRKYPDAPVAKILEAHADRRFNPSDFGDFWIELPDDADRRTESDPATRLGPVEPVLETCAFLQHCRDHAATLPEPHWYAMLSNLVRLEGGRAAAHAFSRPYPGYTTEETDAKLDRAATASGPIGCAKIQELGFTGCPTNGHGVPAPAWLAWPEKERRSVPGPEEPSTAPPAAPRPDRPLIRVSGDLPEMAEAAWSALTAANDPPILFRRGPVPVRLEQDHAMWSTRLLTADRLRHHLARASRWERVERTKKGERWLETLPPVAVVLDLLATPASPLPPLDRIVTVPTFAPSGRLRVRPGYDPEGHVYYAPPEALVLPSIPVHPDAAAVRAARHLLQEDLLGEFPFTSAAERAHALALILQPFVRELVDGPTPLYLAESPQVGTGKTLLVTTALWPALGRPAAAMTEGRDEDEWRKRITAKLLASADVVFLDNLRQRLDAAALAAAITATVYEDRILGRSEVEAVPVRCLWVASGNNPVLSLELVRRAVRIRLDAKTEEPWTRAGFRHPLPAWAQAERGALIAAALTLAQAWLGAGRPAYDGPTLGMFEAWSRVLGGILVHAGVPGFPGNRDDFLQAADPEGAEVRAFLAAWWAQYGEQTVPVATLLTLPTLPSRVTDGRDSGQAIRLGKLLRSRRDAVSRLTDVRVRLERGDNRDGAALWRLRRVPAGSDVQGSQGS